MQPNTRPMMAGQAARSECQWAECSATFFNGSLHSFKRIEEGLLGPAVFPCFFHWILDCICNPVWRSSCIPRRSAVAEVRATTPAPFSVRPNFLLPIRRLFLSHSVSITEFSCPSVSCIGLFCLNISTGCYFRSFGYFSPPVFPIIISTFYKLAL